MKKYPYKCKNDNRICDYGCEKKANWRLKNGKCCCSENHASCPGVKTGPSPDKNYFWSKEEFINAWKNGDSITNVAQTLYDEKVNGGRKYRRIKSYAENLGLNTDKKKNQLKAFGSGPRPDRRKNLNKILSSKHSDYPTNRLKERLFESGKKQKRCEKCKIKNWEGENAPLELHHINGNPKDHRLKNLKILCPNCHALTDNYRGKNK